MITDKTIRHAMNDSFNDDGMFYIEELAIPKRVCLADIVMTSKRDTSGLHGYEIKSEVDSLKRLPLQIEYYSRVFERCTLIVAENHEEKARDMIPDWWGIIVVVREGFDSYGEPTDSFTLLDVREASLNPNPRQKYALLQLLWRNELLELISSYELDIDRSLKKRGLREQVAKELSSEQLEQQVKQFLLKRDSWKVPGVANPYYEKRKRERAERARKRRERKKKLMT
ncbi:sce7726 family protein [Exiguobacterium sp. s140]|uniref:sce7726 family protein n=2 Tax=unclassified Exiguobacterium TaxID=2644629 RepID=UPI001BE51B15|nr:sce7726 family protein [Exiguobacterium sp. s140]